MKTIITALLLLSSAAFAANKLSATSADESVKITSFYYLETGSNRTPAAELCGVLTQPSDKAEMIKVTADPKGKQPGIYNTWAGKDGKFCIVLATYTGSAEAELAQ